MEDVVMKSTDEESTNKTNSNSKISELKKKFTEYLCDHTIYETIPENMKILVFNSDLMIKDSIEAMIKEDIYCGLLWDTKLSKYVGLFTIRDVLSLLILSYKQISNYLNNNQNINNLETLTNSINEIFDNWKIKDENNKMDIEMEENNKKIDSIITNFNDFFKLFDNTSINDYVLRFKDKEKDHPLISLYLDKNLQDVLSLIKSNKIHRIVVEEQKSNSVTGFITYEAIFEFFIENYFSEMTEFEIKLKEIDGIITKNIITLNKTDSIFKALDLFYSKKISILPILDGNEIFGYFYLKDIIYFFSNGDKFNFNETIEKFLNDLYENVDDEKPLGNKRIIEVNYEMNLKNIFENMSICPERKLIVKDGNKIGLITLSNCFNNLLDI
jgi:predicted transcriptional regulator